MQKLNPLKNVQQLGHLQKSSSDMNESKMNP